MSDLAEIAKMEERLYHGGDGCGVMRRIAEGEISLWRCLGVTLLCEILQRRTGRELVIVGLYGKGLFRDFDEVLSAAKELARMLSCRWLSGDVQSRGLAKLYSWGGAERKHERYVIEVEEV